MVGTLDGARLWSKEVGARLADVQWSPDGKFLLLVLADGQLHLYESGGTFMTRIRVAAKRSPDETAEPNVSSISWYNGSNGLPDIGSPTLAIALTNGRIVLLRHERDAGTPTIFNDPQRVDRLIEIYRTDRLGYTCATNTSGMVP